MEIGTCEKLHGFAWTVLYTESALKQVHSIYTTVYMHDKCLLNAGVFIQVSQNSCLVEEALTKPISWRYLFIYKSVSGGDTYPTRGTLRFLQKPYLEQPGALSGDLLLRKSEEAQQSANPIGLKDAMKTPHETEFKGPYGTSTGIGGKGPQRQTVRSISQGPWRTWRQSSPWILKGLHSTARGSKQTSPGQPSFILRDITPRVKEIILLKT